MKKSQLSNLITLVYNPDDRDNKMKRVVLRCLINSLTSASCNALMSHFYEEDNPNFEPTLDARNEADAKIRGEQLEDEHAEEVGRIVEMKPYAIAQITNALRYRLYDELLYIPNENHKLDMTVPTPKFDPLIDDEPPKMPVRGEKNATNYDQPMSTQWLLKFRIRKAVEVDQNAVAQFAKMQAQFVGVPTDTDEAAKQLAEIHAAAYQAEYENGKKDQLRLISMKDRVLEELRGMWGSKEIDDADVIDRVTGLVTPFAGDTFDHFKSLPLLMQQKIGKGVSKKLTDAYNSTYRRSKADLALLSECLMLMNVNRKVKLWLDDVDHLIETETQSSGVEQRDDSESVKEFVAKLEVHVPPKQPKGTGRKTKGPKVATQATAA